MSEAEGGSKWVWVFNGAGAGFPAGVFSSREAAEEWIQRHGLCGVLTRYPLDLGVYDWAVETGRFHPKRPGPKHSTPSFIQRFTSAALEHCHYGEDAEDDDREPGPRGTEPP